MMQLVSSATSSPLLAATVHAPLCPQSIASLLHDLLGQRRQVRQRASDDESAAPLHPDLRRGGLDDDGAVLDTQFQRHARFDAGRATEVARDDQAAGLVDGRFHGSDATTKNAMGSTRRNRWDAFSVRSPPRSASVDLPTRRSATRARWCQEARSTSTLRFPFLASPARAVTASTCFPASCTSSGTGGR